ncbi:MAG: hypothetical protein GY708_21780 [Actinomycetia bacterium]|nr:hypothetical protein [Actinomycetes bacterium]MCP4958627.1 hypothetical protein [Actinomycetes bacterium]
MNIEQPITDQAGSDSNAEAPPDLVLLERVEGEMFRVDATLREMSANDADVVALTSWIPTD